LANIVDRNTIEIPLPSRRAEPVFSSGATTEVEEDDDDDEEEETPPPNKL
jgi:hypothetical protein